MSVFKLIKTIFRYKAKYVEPLKTQTRKNYDLMIVALGNPGEKYERTRHNAGWMVAKALCDKYGAIPEYKRKAFLSADLSIEKSSILVVFPTTFMNLSGAAVKEATVLYETPIEKIIVVVDEFNFPTGTVRLKKGGSDGGHNGIASIIKELGTEDFVRLRCGIGKRFGPGGLVDYVLSEFYEEEAEAKAKMIASGVKAIERLSETDFLRASGDINSGRLFETQS